MSEPRPLAPGLRLDPRRLGAAHRRVRAVRVLAGVDSTNDEVRRWAAAGAEPGSVVLAAWQTRGRGRQGRRWHSPAGAGLYLSVLERPRCPTRELTRYTVAASLAACEACRELVGPVVDIDWPNDLTHGHRKVAGILAEGRCGAGGLELVLGAGFNLRQQAGDFPPELAGRASSLRIAAGRALDDDGARLACGYLRRLGDALDELEGGRWRRLAERWESLCPGARGRRVAVRRGTGRGADVLGVTAGIDDTGALRVSCDDGSRHTVRLVDSVTALGS